MQDYLLAIDELNVIVQTSYYTSDKKNKVQQVTDDLLSMLIEAYLMGIDYAREMIYYAIGVNLEKMNDAIYHRIDGKDFADRVAKHVRNGEIEGLQILAESEFHRVFNTAVDDGVKEYLKTHPSIGTKTWHTMNDGRVRDTHTYLEGVTIPISAEFYTYDGDHAPYPSMFQNASNNVNCRCYLTYEIT